MYARVFICVCEKDRDRDREIGGVGGIYMFCKAVLSWGNAGLVALVGHLGLMG